MFVFSSNPHLIGFGTIETMDMIFNSIQSHAGNPFAECMKEWINPIVMFDVEFFVCTEWLCTI